MNFVQRIVYMLLSLKERGLRLRLDKHLRTSATNSTSKTVIAGSCSLTLNTQTNKNIELVKQNMLDIVKNSNFTAEFLLDLIRKRGVKVIYLKNAYKFLALMSEEEGLIPERKGYTAFMLNLLAGNGISFSSKPLFILEKGNNDFYFLLFHLYKLHGYFQHLPGYDLRAQELFKLYSKNPEKCDLSQLGFEDMTALKEAVARDNEASGFVIEVSKSRDGAKNALAKLKDGGANL